MVLRLGIFGLNDRGNIFLGHSHISGALGMFQNCSDTPALEAADRASLCDLNLVADVGFILLVVRVQDGFAVNNLVLERMWNLVRNRDLDRLVARATSYESVQSLATGLTCFLL